MLYSVPTLLKLSLFFQDEILSNCSENINLLHNFLENIHTAQSFVQRKKSRETRRKFVFNSKYSWLSFISFDFQC